MYQDKIFLVDSAFLIGQNFNTSLSESTNIAFLNHIDPLNLQKRIKRDVHQSGINQSPSTNLDLNPTKNDRLLN